MEFSNGAYLFMLQEVSATGAGTRQVGAIQNVLPHAISVSPDEDVPLEDSSAVRAAGLVPYSLDGNGNCWCFLTGESAPDDEYPVAYFVSDQKRLMPPAWIRALADEAHRRARRSHPYHVRLG